MRLLRSWVEKLLARKPARSNAQTALFAFPLVSPWTDSDRSNLEGFLRTATGAKLIARLRATESHCAISGATNVMHASHAAGVTVGYGDAMRQIFSLASACDPQDVKIKVAAEGAEQDYAERMRP